MTKGQGHKVKGQCQICRYVKNNGLGYKSRTYDWIVVKLMYRVDIDATSEVTKGQGHKVNGQGQICSKMLKKCLGYKSLTNDCIFLKLIQMIDFNANAKIKQLISDKLGRDLYLTYLT